MRGSQFLNGGKWTIEELREKVNKAGGRILTVVRGNPNDGFVAAQIGCWLLLFKRYTPPLLEENGGGHDEDVEWNVMQLCLSRELEGLARSIMSYDGWNKGGGI